MKRKKFKKQKDLIKEAIKNIELDHQLTYNKKLAKNILILGGIRNPSLGLIREAMKGIKKNVYSSK